MDQWYVARGNAKKGPFTSAQLHALAKKGQLRATDMLLREGTRKWIAAGKFSELFPARSEAEPTPDTPPPVDPLSTSDPRPARFVKPLWVWIGAGAMGVCLLVIVPLLFVVLFVVGRSGSDPTGAGKQIAENTEQPMPPSPKKGDGKTPDKKSGAGESGVGPAPPVAAEDDLELPPVGPTKVAAGDPLMAKFKKARAAYLGARVEARLNVSQAFGPAFDEIEKGNLDAATKAKAKQDLMTDQQNYFDLGRAPTHPLVKKAVEEYPRFIEAATRKFGQAADEALAAYEKQGVNEPEKLRPLRAGQLCGKHADLIGVWTRWSEDSSYRRETWIIDFDERTGRLQVAGIERDHNSNYAVFHGDNVEIKDGALSCSAVQLNPETGRVWAKGMTVILTPQKGKLRYEMRDRVTGSAFDAKKGVTVWIKKTVVGELHRSTEFGPNLTSGSDFVHLVYHLKKAGITGLEHKPQRPVEILDVADANSVWRRLALLASFGYLFDYEDLIPHEQLYLPYRSSHLDLENRNPRLTADLLRQYETLADSPHPYLKRAAVQAFALCRNRLRLAQANDEYGNTAASSLREFQGKVFIPAMEYALLREKDRQDTLAAYPGSLIVASDGPLSKESQEKLAEYLKGVGNLQQDVQKRGKVSDRLAYADMAEADRTVAFWQKHLLPLAKRCAGPKSNQPLVSVTGGWGSNRSFSGRGLKRLSAFHLQNVGDQELTHAVIEIVAENEWGDKAAHYCYLPHLDIGETAGLVPHPRLDWRLLDYATTTKVTWSVRADQGTEVDRRVTLTNPAPYPDGAAARKDHLRLNVPDRAEWEALAVMMQRTTALPGNDASQRVLLREASRPGTSYIFRLPDAGKPGRTLLLRFRPGTKVEVEIVDPQTQKPFQAKMPVWKSQMDGQGGASIFFGTDGNWEQSGWAFALGLDDQPMIYCPGGGNASAPFPAREIPLFLVNYP